MLTAVTQTPPPHHRGLTQDAELGVGADVLVAVGSRAAVAARVVVGDAADDQVGAEQQRELLVPAQKDRRGSAGRPPPCWVWVWLRRVCVHPPALDELLAFPPLDAGRWVTGGGAFQHHV